MNGRVRAVLVVVGVPFCSCVAYAVSFAPPGISSIPAVPMMLSEPSTSTDMANVPVIVDGSSIVSNPVEAAGQVSPEIAQGPETVAYSEEEIGAQGNWVKKREWLKQSRELHNEIIAMCDEIDAYRDSFYRDKNEQADNALDDFYRQSGVARGDLTSMVQTTEQKLRGHIDTLTKWLHELQTRSGSAALSDAELQLYDLDGKIASFKDDIEQVKFDIESVADMDSSISDRLEAIDGYIKLAIEDRQKGAAAIDFMFAIVDHEKARIKYYEIKGMYDRVKAIRDYVKQTASRDFESLISSINETIGKINNQLQTMNHDVAALGDKIDSSRRTLEAHNASAGKVHTSVREFLKSLLPF